MCKRLMGNLNLLDSVRTAYSNKEAFDNHPTTKHKEQSSFPEQIMGMWFCIQNKFFEVSCGKVPYQYPLQGNLPITKPVPKLAMNVKEKGERKVKENFATKLHDCFSSFRKIYFEKVAVSEDNIP